jgi:hypothetical protein
LTGKQRLAFEASFQESARAAIFSVGPAGNRLVERAHEPANRAKALADDIQALGIANRLIPVDDRLPNLNGVRDSLEIVDVIRVLFGGGDKTHLDMGPVRE